MRGAGLAGSRRGEDQGVGEEQGVGQGRRGVGITVWEEQD